MIYAALRRNCQKVFLHKSEGADPSNIEQGLMSRAVPAQVRSNLVIAVGDLAFRYPNVLEPWTHNMYRPLSDPDKGKPLLASLKNSFQWTKAFASGILSLQYSNPQDRANENCCMLSRQYFQTR